MAKRDGKGRQIELAIDELAGVLADASAGSASAWLGWMKSGDFGYRKEHWERLADSVGKRLAKAGWPGANTQAMDEFLAWARPRRGSNMSDFYEGEFLRLALKSGASATDDIAAGLAWAERAEGQRREHVKGLPPRTLTDRERADSFARFSLPVMDLSERAWREASQARAWAAPALFDSAAHAFAMAFAKDPEGELAKQARLGAGEAAKAMGQEGRDRALRSLFTSYDRGVKKKEARALLASDLAGLGARWTAKVEHFRTGRKQSAVDLLMEEGNAFAAKAAMRDLGEEAFWRAFDEAAREWVKWPRQAKELSLWLGELGEGGRGSARLALRAASLAARDDEDGAAVIKEVFEALGPLARIQEMSAWDFAGFAEPCEPKSWAPRAGADEELARKAPMSAKNWLSGSGGKAYALARGEAKAFAELIEQLSRRGVEPPWPAGDAGRESLPEGFKAALERWDLALAVGAQNLPKSKMPSARV